MKKDFLKKIGKSALRIVAALAIILGIPALCYWAWQPGSNEPLPEYANNAPWQFRQYSFPVMLILYGLWILWFIFLICNVAIKKKHGVKS